MTPGIVYLEDIAAWERAFVRTRPRLHWVASVPTLNELVNACKAWDSRFTTGIVVSVPVHPSMPEGWGLRGPYWFE